MADSSEAEKIVHEVMETIILSEKIISIASDVIFRCDQKIDRLRRTKPQIVSITIFSRMINHALASNHLLRQGLGIQAAILTRSIFEEWVNLTYINSSKTNTADELADRFIQYPKMAGYQFKKKVPGIGNLLTPKLEVVISNMKNDFRGKFPDGQESDWSGKTIKEKCVDCRITEAIKVYDSIYFTFSNLSHGSPIALEPNFDAKDVLDSFVYWVGVSRKGLLLALPAMTSLLVSGGVQLSELFAIERVSEGFSPIEARLNNLLSGIKE